MVLRIWFCHDWVLSSRGNKHGSVWQRLALTHTGECLVIYLAGRIYKLQLFWITTWSALSGNMHSYHAHIYGVNFHVFLSCLWNEKKKKNSGVSCDTHEQHIHIYTVDD